jgi:TRAP-type uncharacterized transport system fused permease subunit
VAITITSLVGMVGVGAALEGFYFIRMNAVERIVIFTGGIMLIDPGLYTDITGISIFSAVTVLQILKKRKITA